MKERVPRLLKALRLAAGFGGMRARGYFVRGLLPIALALVTVQVAAAQQHTVSGRVTNPELAPIGGVNVVVKGTTIGTITNANGNFTINAPSPADTLVFSALGSARIEVAIGGRTTIAVTLAQQAIALEELVVVGYGTQTRALVSGSVSSVSAEDVERTSGATTGEALLGKIQGINVRRGGTNMSVNTRDPSDGRPGAPPAIQIRNYGNPLYVIDGVPREARDFHHLNPADIENVSILKDASAAVYGFRAANGVILVTTKKGSTLQKPQFRLDGYYGWQNLPRSRASFGYGVTAYQQIYSYLEHEQNVGIPRSRTPEEMQTWLTAPTYETWNAAVNNPNAPQANLNASVSGGTDDTQYYLSMGHLTQDYAMLDNNFNRSNLQANLRTNLFEGFSIGAELRGRIETQKTIAATSIYDPAQNLMRGVQSPHSHQPFYANDNPNYIAGNVRILARSPVTMRRDISGYQDQIRRNGTGNFWAEYRFPFGTTLKGTYSYGYDTEQLDYQTKTFDGYCYDADTDTYNVCGQILGASRRHLRGQGESNFVQLLANHALTLGEHSVAAVGAFELNGGQNWQTQLISVPPSNYSHLVNLVDVTGLQNTWGIERRASYAGRLNYDFRKKYLLEVLGRYDGSYLYAEGKRWGFFPGVSAGWRLTEEPFLRDRFDFLDELKLRASWGQTGREQGISAWGYLGGASYGAGNGAVLNGQQVTGVRPRGLPVTNLSWVTATMSNVGFDFTLLQGRVTGEFDVFERKLTGLPAARYDVTLPIEVGYTLPNENLNSEANVGFDAALTYNGSLGKIGYSVSPNITLARQKNLERYKPRYGNSWDRYRTGQENRWTGVNFGYEVIGQFQSMEEIYNYPVNIDLQGNRSLLPGDYIYRDTNNDGLINAMDMRPIAYNTSTSGTPILSWGLNGGFNYGSFNLAYDFYGGNYYSIATDLDRKIPFNADHGGAAYWNSRWRRADVFNDQSEWIPGRYPPLRRGDQNHSSYRDNDVTVTNLNFLRVQRVELGYSVPTELSSRIGSSAMRLYSSVTNPYVMTFYGQDWSQDPEGAGGQAYPFATVINVGFSASLGGGARNPVGVPVPPTADDD